MKGITSEMWGRMKEGLQVKESFAGAIAFRSGDLVLWRSNHKELSAMQMFELDWKLLKEEEKEIETELDIDEYIFNHFNDKYQDEMSDVMQRYHKDAKKEKGIETERWMRVQNHADLDILYGLSNDDVSYTPSEVMDKKNFLRWVGTMPDGSAWTNTNSFRLWVGKDIWSYNYCPEDGNIKQIFAKYAEMRVEK